MKRLATPTALAILTTFCAAFAANAGDQKEEPAAMKCENGQCIISTVSPHAAPQPHSPKAEAPDVLKTLEKIVKAYSSGDLKTYEVLLDNDCTYYDPEHKKEIVGKPQVVEHLKNSFERHAPNGPEPLLSYTIDQPYIKVAGKMAVVTYHAAEEIGGAKHHHASGMITKIFIRDGEEWKQQHDHSIWHDLPASAVPPQTTKKKVR